MTATYDLILRNGVVVNHDGVGVRDIGVCGGRIAALATSPRPTPARSIDCDGPSHPAGRDGHPGAFPRARRGAQGGSGDRLAGRGARRRHRRLRDAEHQPADHLRRRRLQDKLGRALHRMHCDHAFWVGGTRDNIGDVPELERLPGAAGIKVFMGSSTGGLLVADDESVRRILAQTQPALRLSLGGRVPPPGAPRRTPAGRSGEPSGVARRGGRALRCTRRLVAIARETGALVHVLHVSTAEEMRLPRRSHKDVASVEVTPHHLTLSADDYAAPRHALQMNPPVRDPPSRRRLGRRRGTASPTSSAPTTRRTRWRKRPNPTRSLPPACRACRRWCR